MLHRRKWLGITAGNTLLGIGLLKVASGDVKTSSSEQGNSSCSCNHDSSSRKFSCPCAFRNASELLRNDPITPICDIGTLPSHWNGTDCLKCGEGPCGIAKEYGESGPWVNDSQIKEYLDDDDHESAKWLHALYKEFYELGKDKTEVYELGVGIGEAQILDGPKTRFLGYGVWKGNKANPQTPGPMMMARLGHPMILRFINTTNDYMSVHLHGSHAPAHSDGHPAFVIPKPQKTTQSDESGTYGYFQNHRDYFYPHTVPANMGPNTCPYDRVKHLDITESPSTLWYHDHSMDVTGPHVYMGLAGFMPFFDDLELGLLKDNVLPLAQKRETGNTLDEIFESCKLNPLDRVIAIQDRQFSDDNQLVYSAKGHNGTLGNTVLINGMVHPKITVAPCQYRYRILNGSNARFYKLELFARIEDASTGEPKSELVKLRKKIPSGEAWHRIGRDSWLFPHAIRQDKILLASANRADVIIDFEKISHSFGEIPDDQRLVVYLGNVLEQESGRGPKGKLEDGNAQELPPVIDFEEVNVANEDEDHAKGEMDHPWMILKFVIAKEFSELPSCIDSEGNDGGHAFGRLGYTSMDQIPRAQLRKGTPLRPHRRIANSEIARTREVVFARGNGIWQVNDKVVNEFLSDFVPELNTAECWILENGGGGWWHPIHIHLESHQQIESLKETESDEVRRILAIILAEFDQAVVDEKALNCEAASEELERILVIIRDSLHPLKTKVINGTLAPDTNDPISLQKLTKAGIKLLEIFSEKRLGELSPLDAGANGGNAPLLRLREAYSGIEGKVRLANADLIFEDGRMWRRMEIPEWDRYKSDTAILGPNTRIKIHMHFRTFDGPFASHCHNLEHEDMRMMFIFDPRPTPSKLRAPDKIDDKNHYHSTSQVVRYRHPWRFSDDSSNDSLDFDRFPHIDSGPTNELGGPLICRKEPDWHEKPIDVSRELRAHPIWGGWDAHL